MILISAFNYIQNDYFSQNGSSKSAVIFRVAKSQQADKKSFALKEVISLENTNHKKRNL